MNVRVVDPSDEEERSFGAERILTRIKVRKDAPPAPVFGD